MRLSPNLVRLAVASSLLVSAAAFAANPYTVTPVSGVAEALGPQGQVAFWTTTPAYDTGMSASQYTITGTNGAGQGYQTRTGSTPFQGNDFTFVAVNSAGTFAAEVTRDVQNSSNLAQVTGAVYTSNGQVTWLPDGSQVTGLNSTGAVAFNDANGAAFLQAGATRATRITDLGFGATTTQLNDSGQITGAMYQSDGTQRAYRTGANGLGGSVFGTGNGISSWGDAINNAGQVGGAVQLVSGQMEAFLTTARGGLLVGLGAGAAGDNTETLFVNNLGQAIVADWTTSAWYLYSGGLLAPITAAQGDQIVGFNDAGQILLRDPELLTPLNVDPLLTNPSDFPGAVDVRTTDLYSQLAQAQGATPDASFFSNPLTSSDSVPVQSLPTASSVPAPGSLSLFGLGGLLAAIARRRRTV